MKTNTIELYIHIPFCKSKCRYCDFCSFRAEEETIHTYLGKLKEELIFWGKKLAARDVVTVFIGGGTPSYLRREDIQMICETIFEHFHICEDAEITIEANPGTVDLKKLCTYRENGINRIVLDCSQQSKKSWSIWEEFIPMKNFYKVSTGQDKLDF